MTVRIRTTISVPIEVHAIFVRMAAAANMSVSRTMGDWLTDTADAATLITSKMEEAKKAPMRVMRELRAMVAGMGEEVDSIMEEARKTGALTVRDAQRRGPPESADSAPVTPCSNTGGNTTHRKSAKKPWTSKYEAAIEVFEDLAAGREFNNSSAIAGALSLEFPVLPKNNPNTRDFQDAFLSMKTCALGMKPDLDDAGKARCIEFAEMLRGQK